MLLATSRTARKISSRSQRRQGAALLEVLTAIFIMGIGLLAVLTLFPLGAQEMARAIRDDRAAAVAQRAEALSETGRDVLARSRMLVIRTMISGRVDTKAAGLLRRDYGMLRAKAAEIEQALGSLQTLIKEERLHRLLDALLAQISYIQAGFATIESLHHWLEQYQP